MVPVEVLFALTVVFFLREVYVRSRPTDYESGYRQALEDIAKKWNEGKNKQFSYMKQCTSIHEYLQKKLDGM